ncbi:methyltransferase [Kutzneria buriramensis]|uniref:O-methyltransferase n=1 Tax=Kutzneria buriramensis TaxID=1045776 RepID=A0A3E0H2G4_9PSEU|nr:methyltransferase [Kutzneria buriramensis]REH37224.1 O-methyltransferase [Kutzneria buriramensis]
MTGALLGLHRAAATLSAYSAAVQLGLIDYIDRTPATVDDLAMSCGASVRGVRVVLAALVDSGLVTRRPDGRYEPVTAGLAGVHPLLPWRDQVTDSVRTGLPAREAERDVITVLLHGMRADVVTELPAATRVLDVSVDGAPCGVALAARDPRCRVSVLDVPANRRAAAGPRFDFLPGGLFDAQPAADEYDLVVLSGVCHLLDADCAAELIRRYTPAVRRGGALTVIDTLAGSQGAATHELSLLLRTRGGTIHAPADYQRWLVDAGLVAATRVDVGRQPALTVLTGLKP